MEWIHQNWQLVSFVLIHIGYLLQSEVKKAMRLDLQEKRLEHLEKLTETGLAAKCQVHAQQLLHLEKRVDNLESRR